MVLAAKRIKAQVGPLRAERCRRWLVTHGPISKAKICTYFTKTISSTGGLTSSTSLGYCSFPKLGTAISYMIELGMPEGPPKPSLCSRNLQPSAGGVSSPKLLDASRRPLPPMRQRPDMKLEDFNQLLLIPESTSEPTFCRLRRISGKPWTSWRCDWSCSSSSAALSSVATSLPRAPMLIAFRGKRHSKERESFSALMWPGGAWRCALRVSAACRRAASASTSTSAHYSVSRCLAACFTVLRKGTGLLVLLHMLRQVTWTSGKVWHGPVHFLSGHTLQTPVPRTWRDEQ